MWIDPILTIDLILKGLLVGVIASAPMGPVGVLTVRRTLNKGLWYGFATGVGAAVSDMIYAVLTVLGMRVILDFVQQPATLSFLKFAGSAMLFVFGWYTYRAKASVAPPPGNVRGNLFQNGFTGFLVTLSNPLIIFLFMILFARFEFVRPNHPIEQAVGMLSVIVGALLWWFGLTFVINKVRNRFQMETIGLINRVIGAVVMVAAIVGLAFAFQG